MKDKKLNLIDQEMEVIVEDTVKQLFNDQFDNALKQLVIENFNKPDDGLLDDLDMELLFEEN